MARNHRRLVADLMHLDYTQCKKGYLEIAFIDSNLAYTPEEIRTFKKMWCDGHHIADMYDALRRQPIEVMLLALWLDYTGRIKPRPGGVLGVN